MSDSQDNGSEILKAFQRIATRCVAHLREAGDAGTYLTTHDIGIVQDAIVKELGILHFNGLDVGEAKAKGE